MPDETPPSAPRQSAGHSPLRPPRSIRRTSSLETNWPDGQAGNLRVIGRARDAVTQASGDDPIVCAMDTFEADLQWDRTIMAITSQPARANIGRLVGARGGGHLRSALDELLPDERRAATPLHLILDDISGASLVAGWAWSRWNSDWQRGIEAAATADSSAPMRRPMEGVCMGFRPGSSALSMDGSIRSNMNPAKVVDLRHPADPEGWHPFSPQEGAAMRRARRIDVWLDGVIHVDSTFQDSATDPSGGRVAIHEYGLTATADPVTLELLSLTPDPRVLPFPECPSAVANAQRMVGTRLTDLREKVLVELKGTAGCTHLNDVLRSLAEVGALAERLKATLAEVA